MSLRLSQCQQILSLFRGSRDRIVSCRQFEDARLYHKLSSRLSDLKNKHFIFEYIPSPTPFPLDASYKLVSEPVEIAEEASGQLVFR